MFVATAVLTVVIAAMFLGAGIAKLAGADQMVQVLDHLGVSPSLQRAIGGLEILGAAGLIVGLWFGPLGIAVAAGLLAMMIGALGYHVRAHDSAKDLSGALMLSVFSGLVLGLRLATL